MTDARTILATIEWEKPLHAYQHVQLVTVLEEILNAGGHPDIITHLLVAAPATFSARLKVLSTTPHRRFTPGGVPWCGGCDHPQTRRSYDPDTGFLYRPYRLCAVCGSAGSIRV